MKQNKSLIDLIPNKIQVGDQDIDVSFVDSIEDGYLGLSQLCCGRDLIEQAGDLI